MKVHKPRRKETGSHFDKEALLFEIRDLLVAIANNTETLVAFVADPARLDTIESEVERIGGTVKVLESLREGEHVA